MSVVWLEITLVASCKSTLGTNRWDTSDHRVGYFSPRGRTVRTMGLDHLVLRYKVSFGHFGTGAEMSRHFGPIWTVPKCLSAELSPVQSVQLPLVADGTTVVKLQLLDSYANNLLWNRNKALTVSKVLWCTEFSLLALSDALHWWTAVL